MVAYNTIKNYYSCQLPKNFLWPHYSGPQGLRFIQPPEPPVSTPLLLLYASDSQSGDIGLKFKRLLKFVLIPKILNIDLILYLLLIQKKTNRTLNTKLH